MRTTLATLLFGIVACSHSQPAAQTPGTPGAATEPGTTADADEQIDPTLPSWAPRACSGYHAAVVRALSCDEIAQPARDLIKKTYDARHDGWQALTDAPQGKIDEIGKQCRDDAQSVRTEHAGKCGMTAAR